MITHGNPKEIAKSIAISRLFSEGGIMTARTVEILYSRRLIASDVAGMPTVIPVMKRVAVEPCQEDGCAHTSR
jgi:hypothetical protein